MDAEAPMSWGAARDGPQQPPAEGRRRWAAVAFGPPRGMTALPLATAARGGKPGGLATALNDLGQALADMAATAPEPPPPPPPPPPADCKQM